MKELLEFLSKPLMDTGTFTKDVTLWQNVEKNIGITLPDDYKLFVNTYGEGSIERFLWILNPFSENEHINLEKGVKEILETYSYVRKDFPEIYTHPPFPAKGGLLPWGATNNGDDLYWLTKDKPNCWTVVVDDRGNGELIEYDLNMTDFLYKVLSKELICPAFPEDFPSTNPEYIV